MIKDVECGAANRNPEVIRSLVIEDAGVVQGADEHHREDEAEGADVVAEHNCSRLDADLDVITTVLACIDGI